MLVLSEDDECIVFASENKISLPLLKNEIDRRILKITSMLMNLPSTTSLDLDQEELKQWKVDNILAINDVVVNKTIETSEKTEFNEPKFQLKASFKKEKQSKTVNGRNKENNLIQNQLVNQLLSRTVKISDVLSTKKQELLDINTNLLQSYKFTFHPEPNQRNSGSDADRKVIQSFQDQKIFVDMDVRQENMQGILNLSAIDDFQASNQVQNRKSKTAIPEKLASSQQHYSISEFLDRSQNVQKVYQASKKNSSFGQQSKVEMFQKPLPVEKRIAVSQDCLLRMLEQIQRQLPKNRKEAADNKLRSNIIKRIADKFGNGDINA